MSRRYVPEQPVKIISGLVTDRSLAEINAVVAESVPKKLIYVATAFPEITAQAAEHVFALMSAGYSFHRAFLMSMAYAYPRTLPEELQPVGDEVTTLLDFTTAEAIDVPAWLIREDVFTYLVNITATVVDTDKQEYVTICVPGLSNDKAYSTLISADILVNSTRASNPDWHGMFLFRLIATNTGPWRQEVDDLSSELYKLLNTPAGDAKENFKDKFLHALRQLSDLVNNVIATTKDLRQINSLDSTRLVINANNETNDTIAWAFNQIHDTNELTEFILLQYIREALQRHIHDEDPLDQTIFTEVEWNWFMLGQYLSGKFALTGYSAKAMQRRNMNENQLVELIANIVTHILTQLGDNGISDILAELINTGKVERQIEKMGIPLFGFNAFTYRLPRES